MSGTTEQILSAAFGAPSATTATSAQVSAVAPGGTTDTQHSALVDVTTGLPVTHNTAVQQNVQAVAPADSVSNSVMSKLLQAERSASYYRAQAEAARETAEQQRQQQEAALYAQQQQAYAYDPSQDALTADEMAVYGSSMPFVEKVARQIAYQQASAAAQQVEALREHIVVLEKRMADMGSMASHSTEVALMSAVRAAVPDLDAITKTKEWKAYSQKIVPFSGGKTVKESLLESVAARNPDVIREHLIAFKQMQQNASGGAQPQIAPAPGRSSSSSVVGLNIPTQQRAISVSALDAAAAKVRAGTMTQAAYDAVLQEAFAGAAQNLAMVA